MGVDGDVAAPRLLDRLHLGVQPMTISVDELHEILKYDPDTGSLTWRERTDSFPAPITSIRIFNSKFANKPVYEEVHKGYRRIRLFGKSYKSHRVAWAMHHGAWPEDQIDHINGERSDNRIENLRAVTQFENSRNMKIPSKNMSGVIGVAWDKLNWKWRVSIGTGKNHIYLGYFKSFEEAVSVRRSAEVKYGYHPNHGKR